MRAIMHVGFEQTEGGRAGDEAAKTLSRSIEELGFKLRRLKTGTPPRLHKDSIDWSKTEPQPGDEKPIPFSFYYRGARFPELTQLNCFITYTNYQTHEIIEKNFDRSPMFIGVIEGVGPRYCPSIEDKIHRFADKDSHQVFLEPEGLTTHEVYPQGVSTSLPFDVQLDLVRSLRGLENAHIVRPGYAIEYDYFDPCNLKSSLETKSIGGLFFAGQINGTTGYEEAAAQGLLAGANAALQARGRVDGWRPRRDQAYLGVLVDDLITRGVSEPYRMFTSRAEYRLSLREDNADLRLTEIGRELGLVDDHRWGVFNRKRDAISIESERLKSTWVNPKLVGADDAMRVLGQAMDREYRLFDLLRRPQVAYVNLATLPGFGSASELDAQVIEQVEIQAKYQGYIDRQLVDVHRTQSSEALQLPADLDYATVHGLSIEVQQRLKQHQPETLGQASRIQGVTPAAISLLLVHLKRRSLVDRSRT